MTRRWWNLFLCGLVVVCSRATAGDEHATRLDTIVASGEIRVGVTGDYRPFSFYDPVSSQWEGFDIDMTSDLASKLGVKATFVKTTWPNLGRDFESDRFDVAAGGVSITPERALKGDFSSPVMRDGKTPISRCADAGRYGALAEIDRPDTRVIVNPGGTNERFARDRLKRAAISVFPDNVGIFDEIVRGSADVMITDVSETLFQQKLHPGVLCAIHPDAPFDFAEKAFWLRRDAALKGYVDRWLHLLMETGRFATLRDKWFR